MNQSLHGAFRVARDEGRKALLPFLMSGHPSPDAFANNLRQVAAYADVIEVGVPFSDPLADGPVIQHAAEVALRHRTTLSNTFATLASRDPGPPVVLMLSVNQVLARGIERFASDAAQAGVSGAIIPDLPHEEAADVRAQFARRGLSLIAMLAPTTPPARMAAILGQAQGFAYLISVAGVTGARQGCAAETADYIRRARELSTVPVCVGFGIGKPGHIHSLSGHADGFIVGSALIRAIDEGHSLGDVLAPLQDACRQSADHRPLTTGAKS